MPGLAHNKNTAVTNAQVNLTNRLISLAPKRPYCSDNKTASLIWSKEIAFRKCSYIQLNTVSIVNWLIIDLDHTNPFIFEDVGVAIPNIVTINKENGHSQYFYAITGVCTSENARIHPQAYLNSVKKAYRKALNGDDDFNSPMSKNPLSDEWQTYFYHDSEFSLGELADYHDIKLEITNFYSASNDDNYESRNCSLFHAVRHIAYKEVDNYRQNSSYRKFESFILNTCERLNNFHGKDFYINANLRANEVGHIAKSITKWVWERYFGGGKINKGVMGLKALNIDLKEKQRLSAKRTHEYREQKTEQKIQAALRVLSRDENKKLTQTNVAAAAGITRKTVGKFKHLIEAFKRQGTELKKVSLKAVPKNVTFGSTSDNSAVKRQIFKKDLVVNKVLDLSSSSLLKLIVPKESDP